MHDKVVIVLFGWLIAVGLAGIIGAIIDIIFTEVD